MKKAINYVSLFIFLLFVFNLNVKANTINNINMDVYIDSKGNASITEVWDVYLDSGTEGYKTFSNLGNSQISNFTVTDDTDRVYETLDNWNVNSSFNEKAYKSGINRNNGKLELCWGISNYGDKKYTLKYNLSNLVTQYSDYQGIYFNFLNLDQKLNFSRIVIHSEIPFSVDNSKIWSFGYNGKINFIDGKIVMFSNGGLDSYQYMVGLVKFEDKLFNTINISNKSFNEIYNSAMEEVNDDNDKTEFMEKYLKQKRTEEIIIITIVIIILSIILSLLFYFSKKNTNKQMNNIYSNNINLEKYHKSNNINKYNLENINYYRDIPCNKDLSRAYFILISSNIIDKNTIKKGLVGAIFLKWIKENKISIKESKNGILNKINYEIVLNDNILLIDETEKELYSILKLAANNNILEVNEFNKWSKEYYTVINCFFDKIINRELKKANEEGYFEKIPNSNLAKFSQKFEEEIIKLIGLKKYLMNFSNFDNAEIINVHLWDEYLMFANLLGVADKVEEQFKSLYPSLVNNLNLNKIIRIIAEDTCKITNNSTEGAKRKSQVYQAFMERDYSNNDRDYGGGGSSYSSGGGSAGGSSGGGFR